MKRKSTDVARENSDVCAPSSEVKKRKKKTKDGNVDSTDAAEATDEYANEELGGKKKSETREAVSGVKKKKKKKKVKKEKDAHVESTESADLTECFGNEDGTKIKDGVEEQEGTEDEDEELSPEERRVLERKLKKLRRKEEKKKQKQKEEEAKSEKEESKSSVAQMQALEYLTCWSETRDEWKFQKTRQVWLLQHMYDSEKVPDPHFSVLLSYLEGLRGVAREITVQKAEALVRFGAGPEGEEGGATGAQKKTQRAREVIQILS